MENLENIISIKCNKLNYETGDFVYVVRGPDEWIETTTRTVVGEIAIIDGKWEFFQRGITVSHLFITREYFKDICYFLEGGDEIIPFYRIFKTAKEATILSQFKKVNITDEEWYRTLGNRDEPISLEEAELEICCADISKARDILYKCQKFNGLIQLDVHYLQKIMSAHKILSSCKILTKIFKQLE
ncbi:MAG: hypothetical protein J7L15_06300 [Clostridiales bacterium]|nr:hypothetical protein [Clostridiales bacterium]